jgi:hypothetical protein
MSSVAGALKAGFINTEGLKSEINNDFSDILKILCFGSAESWTGFDTDKKGMH